jgi:hypothetical protein
MGHLPSARQDKRVRSGGVTKRCKLGVVQRRITGSMPAIVTFSKRLVRKDFDVLTALTVRIAVVWGVMQCSAEEMY